MNKDAFLITKTQIESVLSYLKPNKLTAEKLFFDNTYRTVRTILFYSNRFETHKEVDDYLMNLIQ